MRMGAPILGVVICSAMANLALGQTEPAAPEFEVASIKPAPRRTLMMMQSGQWHTRMDDAAFSDTNISLLDLVTMAFHINADRVDGPGWLSEQTFAVAAKLPAGAHKEQIPAMLQKLLASRFKLAVHHDQKVQSVYLLTIGKEGTKLKESVGDPELRGCNGRPGRYRCTATTIADLAETLTNMAAMYARMPSSGDEHNIDLPVIDQTGLKGIYDIDLQWIPPEGAGRGHRGSRLPPPAPDTKATSIFGAFEAIGLKLQPGKHTFDILVIDHVERTPTEN